MNLQVGWTYGLPACRHVMRYLLRLPSRQLTPTEEMCLETIFHGPILHLYSSPEKLSKLQVVWVPSNRLPRPVNVNVNGYERKQIQVWRNASRNELIADLANAIVHCNRKKLIQLGCQRIYDLLPDDESECSELAILVESLEHAKELQSLLPDWQTYTVDSTAPCRSSCAIVTEAHVLEYGLGIRTVMAAWRTSAIRNRW